MCEFHLAVYSQVRRLDVASTNNMVTPLIPKEFFQGTWRGEGELIPNALLRWFAPREHFYLTSEATWLSDTIWIVNDRFQFSSGRILDRKMYCELVAPNRIHVTADDMPVTSNGVSVRSDFMLSVSDTPQE